MTDFLWTLRKFKCVFRVIPIALQDRSYWLRGNRSVPDGLNSLLAIKNSVCGAEPSVMSEYMLCGFVPYIIRCFAPCYRIAVGFNTGWKKKKEKKMSTITSREHRWCSACAFRTNQSLENKLRRFVVYLSHLIKYDIIIVIIKIVVFTQVPAVKQCSALTESWFPRSSLWRIVTALKKNERRYFRR